MNRMRSLRLPAAALLAASLVCTRAAPLAGQNDKGAPARADARAVHHVMNRLGFGARPGDVDRVRAMGLTAYIDQQLHPEQIADTALEARLADAAARPMTDGRDPRALNELTQSRLLRAVLSERQLNEVLVDFWFNHFNVFAGKGAVRLYLAEYERDVIRPHVLGRFRDLLGAVAHSPAMLFYLDNWQSAAPNDARAMPRRPRAPRGLNENYARELMELHTLGVEGGYTQQDVVEVARALTGWSIDRPRQGGGFVFRPAMHDRGEKVILGERFPAGRGEDEGERVLDLLAGHPSTARFISFKLAQRFVADEPPASLVDRAASVFQRTDGDLREVVRAILTSPEFFGPEGHRAKVKTPLDFVVSAVRATNAAVNTQPLAQALRAQLGMPLYGSQPPTGYSNTADAWVNTGALLTRMNFALRLATGEIRGVHVPVAAIVPDTSEATRDRLILDLLGGDVSPGTSAVLAKADTPPHLLALVLGSPEFQRK